MRKLHRNSFTLFWASGEGQGITQLFIHFEKVIYATGLGPTKGGKVTAGNPSPSAPLAVTDKVQVFFGNPGIKEAEVIVDWSGLQAGTVGVYQINCRVPGAHVKGDSLPVTLRIGGVSSPTTGPNAPFVPVN